MKKNYWRFTSTQQKGATIQNMEFFIKDLFSKYDQILNKLRIWSHLLQQYLIEIFIFLCNVLIKQTFLTAIFPF